MKSLTKRFHVNLNLFLNMLKPRRISRTRLKKMKMTENGDLSANFVTNVINLKEA